MRIYHACLLLLLFSFQGWDGLNPVCFSFGFLDGSVATPNLNLGTIYTIKYVSKTWWFIYRAVGADTSLFVSYARAPAFKAVKILFIGWSTAIVCRTAGADALFLHFFYIICSFKVIHAFQIRTFVFEFVHTVLFGVYCLLMLSHRHE